MGFEFKPPSSATTTQGKSPIPETPPAESLPPADPIPSESPTPSPEPSGSPSPTPGVSPSPTATPVNLPPTLTRINPVSVRRNDARNPVTMNYTEFRGLTDLADKDSNALAFRIMGVLAGVLRINNVQVPLIPGLVQFKAGDTLTWIPPDDFQNPLPAFLVRGDDFLSLSSSTLPVLIVPLDNNGQD